MRVFEIAAVQARLTYNRFGWHDPQGRFFVLKEEIEQVGTLDEYLAKVESGEICPEPLVLRANAGDCVGGAADQPSAGVSGGKPIPA